MGIRWHLLAVGALFIGAGAGCRVASHETLGRRPRVEIQGHRGCRGLRPENTLAAFRHAIALGVDVLELDLGLTRDDVLIVVHDPEVNEAICAGAGGLPTRRFRDLTYRQVMTLDCGARKNPRFPRQQPVPGQRVPRLGQVLDLLQAHPRLRANLEIKTFPERPDQTWPPARFAGLLVQLLARRGLVGRVTVQSFDPAALTAVAALNQQVALSALTKTREEAHRMLEVTGAKILSPRHTSLRQGDVQDFHRRGIRVVPWTVNEQERMLELIRWGVDGIITDYPDLLLAVAHPRSGRSAGRGLRATNPPGKGVANMTCYGALEVAQMRWCQGRVGQKPSSRLE